MAGSEYSQLVHLGLEMATQPLCRNIRKCHIRDYKALSRHKAPAGSQGHWPERVKVASEARLLPSRREPCKVNGVLQCQKIQDCHIRDYKPPAGLQGHWPARVGQTSRRESYKTSGVPLATKISHLSRKGLFIYIICDDMTY